MTYKTCITVKGSTGLFYIYHLLQKYMEASIKDYLTNKITLEKLIKDLQLSISQASYIKQEAEDLRYGESNLEDTVDRIVRIIKSY